MTGILILMALLIVAITAVCLNGQESKVEDLEKRLAELEYSLEMTDDVHDDLADDFVEAREKITHAFTLVIKALELVTNKIGYNITSNEELENLQLVKLNKKDEKSTTKETKPKAVKSTKKTSKK